MKNNKRIYPIAIDKKNKRKCRIEGIEGNYLIGRDLINPDIIYRYHPDEVDRRYVLL